MFPRSSFFGKRIARMRANQITLYSSGVMSDNEHVEYADEVEDFDDDFVEEVDEVEEVDDDDGMDGALADAGTCVCGGDGVRLWLCRVLNSVSSPMQTNEFRRRFTHRVTSRVRILQMRSRLRQPIRPRRPPIKDRYGFSSSIRNARALRSSPAPTGHELTPASLPARSLQMLYIPGIGYIPLSSLGGLGQNLNLGAARQAQVAPPNPEGEREWTGFSEMPSITQDSINDLFGALEGDEKKDLTVLVLGKGGAGKSSTVNSLFNEQAANVQAFGLDNTRPSMYSRVAPSGFVFHVIDTPSLLDQDVVAEGRLEAVAKSIKDKEIDAVIFLDRLDEYSVGSVDLALIKAVTRFFGPSIWENTVLCFSRGAESSAPPGIDFYEHVAQRENQLKNAIAKAAGQSYDMASALVENSSRCPKNNDDEKVVSGDTPWVADVLEKLVEVALNHLPYEYNEEVAKKKSNPNSRRKWLIPLVLAAQVGIKFLLDKVLDDDGCKGDENGPFDAQTVKERREELKEEKKERRAGKKAGGGFAESEESEEEAAAAEDDDAFDDSDDE